MLVHRWAGSEVQFHLRLKIINIGWPRTEQATEVRFHEIKHLANVQISRYPELTATRTPR